jgi:hypothetical protein
VSRSSLVTGTSRFARTDSRVILLLGTLLAAACSSESTGPTASRVQLAVAEGGEQFVLPGGTAALQLAVQATNPATGRTVTDAEVTWRVVEGSGASVSPSTAQTNEVGVASTVARAGSTPGTYRFEATSPRLDGDPATFTLHAVQAPVITSVTPNPVVGGETVTIQGSGFSGTTAQHGVLFGGLRGTVLTVSASQITARAPDCLLSRPTDLRVTLGAVGSNALPVETEAGDVTPLQVVPSHSASVADTDALACMAIEGVGAGSRFLLVLQNAARTASVPMRYELTAIADGGPLALFERGPRSLHRDIASDFELELRARERMLGPPVARPSVENVHGATAIPVVGDTREFNVLTADGGTRRLTATVRLLTQRAIVYVDEDAPAGGLTTTDLTALAALFDDPIYATDTSVFGQPSDVDANDRIIILFTPGVNALTEASSGGFIAGYFYGCDLVSEERCSATNNGEIFYSMVPDPNGEFGGSRSREVVLRTVPAVLAHEFQHMINFARKGERLDVLWLSEGLAHAAEDIVGEVLASRGDMTAASNFRRPNHTRAQLYLGSTAETPLLAEDSPGTLEQRGGAWLLVKYMTGHYGGSDLLARLVSSTLFGVPNIEQATGQPWSDIFSGFTTALWATEVTGLGGPVEPEDTFADLDLRTVITSLGGVYPLMPTSIAFQDFQLTDVLPAGSQDYLFIDVPAATATLRFSLTGPLGGGFPNATRPQLTLFRVR